MTDSDNGDVIISPEPGAVVTTDDPYQDLSEEILGLIGEQGREERVWNEEGRSLGYKKSMERERMINEARFQEHKTNVGIMENGIRYSFIKSSQEMDQMDNGELRNHFVLLETELGDRLESLELELLHFDTAASLLGGDCAVTRQIVKKCKIECKAMIRHLEDLMEKREVARSKPTFTKARLPSFSGVWHQGNIFQFKKKITHNLSKMEVPRDCWTFWILDRLSGPAIMIVKQTHRNLSMVEWDGVMETLIDNFGYKYQLRDSLIGQHQAVGRLAEIFPNTNWAKRSLRLRRHLAIIGEALELHCDHKKEIIDYSYSSTITSILTPKERMRMRERNFILQHTAPLEQVRLVQSEMKKLLEQSTLEAKYSIADAELIPSSDDDPDDSDKNPLFLNS